MKFSIIIPVYNVEPYLEKCLDSVTNQTYKNFEVIIVNDSSPDNSQKIIDKYVKKDKRFKGYIKENGGVSSVRNYGLQKVSGDYILFLDGDDYIDISLLEELSKKIANQYPDIVRFSLSTVTEKNELIKEIPIKLSNNKSYKITGSENISLYLKNDTKVNYVYEGVDKISYKTKKGAKLGTIKIYEDDKLLETSIVYLEENIKYYPLELCLIILITLIIVIIFILKNKKRKRRRRKWQR